VNTTGSDYGKYGYCGLFKENSYRNTIGNKNIEPEDM
jgi:hypothetical protein